MAKGRSILVDTSKCTACRGCQVACKQWNALPGTKTKQIGTYQNPQDLSGDTWKLVRFSEGRKDDGKPYWYFFSEQCRHCLDPPCADTIRGYVDNGVIIDEKTGAVVYTAKASKAPFDEVQSSCPYNIPRQKSKGKDLVKCTMCLDRISDGMPPACVKSCPTGTLQFGDRDEILSAAKARVAELRKTHPKAMAIDADSVRVIYIVVDEPPKYFRHAAA